MWNSFRDQHLWTANRSSPAYLSVSQQAITAKQNFAKGEPICCFCAGTTSHIMGSSVNSNRLLMSSFFQRTCLGLHITEALHLSCATAWQSRCRTATLILHHRPCILDSISCSDDDYLNISTPPTWCQQNIWGGSVTVIQRCYLWKACGFRKMLEGAFNAALQLAHSSLKQIRMHVAKNVQPKRADWPLFAWRDDATVFMQDTK